MEKSRIEIEHTLNSTSRNIIWQLIGTAAGLEKWLADSVQIDGDKAEFGWGDDWCHHEIRCATVITIDKFKRIVWRWDDEDDTSYVEIRMERSQMTQQYTLYNGLHGRRRHGMAPRCMEAQLQAALPVVRSLTP